jgi:hypothetical protein
MWNFLVFARREGYISAAMRPSFPSRVLTFSSLGATLIGLTAVAAVRADITVGVEPFAFESGDEIVSLGTGFDGAGPTNELGETIAVPAGYSILDSFSVYASAFNGKTAGLNAFVIQWSNTATATVGSALWSSSAPVVFSGTTNTLETFNTGGVTLNPGDEYLLAFTGDHSEGENDDGSLLTTAFASLPYTGGQEVDRAGTTYFPEPSNIVFEATFSAVPEPAMGALVLGGLAGFAMIRRRGRFPSICDGAN